VATSCRSAHARSFSGSRPYDAGVTQTVRLTAFSHGAGCACKLSPADLREVLGLVRGIGGAPDPNLLVGFDTSDDAAVYKVRDDLAVVVTTDFFTPIVDDPFDWGRIAATNALSDIYAMGATPLLALNLVAWPREALSFALLAQVLDGGADVARDAQCLIAGGHSIDDAEPKYGLAVVGTVHPDHVLTNAGAQPGDALVLTKPIGLGIISTAVKRDIASSEDLARAVDVMTALNAGARDAALEVGVHAATDITGFGLLGHLREMCVASGVGAVVDAGAVPVIDGVRELLAAGMVAGGTQRNHAFVAPDVNFGDLTEAEQLLLADAQTSGGLLLAVPRERADALVAACRAHGTLTAARVGTLTDEHPGRIIMRRTSDG
jgi:selenide,water dikinase